MPDSTPVGNRRVRRPPARRGSGPGRSRSQRSQSCTNVQVSLSAEVALNYVELRNYQTRLEIAKANADSQLETLKLTQWRAEAGLTTALDVEQSSLESRTDPRPNSQSRHRSREAEHRLAILLGQQPGTLHSTLANSAKIPEIPERVIVTIPADTLRQRPDARAERTLAAETARIGEVEAKRYPSFNLSGSIGSGLDPRQLEQRRCDHGILIGIDRRADLRRRAHPPAGRDSKRRCRSRHWSTTNRRCSVRWRRSKMPWSPWPIPANASKAQNATRAAQLAALLARHRYTTGIIDFQTVLDTERTVLTLEDSLTASEAEQVSALIQLYKALGGGWSLTSVETVASAQGKSS